jgi:hypothetical protein
MAVKLTITGEGMSFEREIPESAAMKVLNVVMDNGTSRGSAEVNREAEGSATTDNSALPSNFFNRLSNGQEAFVRVLLNDGGWVTSEEIRQRMEAEYGHSADAPQAISGIRSGFTRKYGDDFDLIIRNWMGRQNEYKLNEQYSEELAEGLEP